MEAASARYASRDRFSTFTEPAKTPLQRYIHQAVDPSNYEPNLALNLEIADLINSKKGTAPREASVTIVNCINNRNQNVSWLALSLLDICVKNCGYPFHLQISTKEFLNELVRRFPERPPPIATKAQKKILELIEEWRSTICQTSRYKEDLGFIRDMHRLLSYKGYVFPETRRDDATVLNPTEALRSAEEMEEEDREAQSAKLQELIRRGRPEDLQEANRLMKVMAGYDTRNKTDYRAKAAEEVGRIQQKARLLEERLQDFKAGDTMEEGDVFEELANALKSAQPKIQKMCEEESDDQDAVAKLFEINDSIHRTIERYNLMKAGDVAAAGRIPHGTLGTTTGVFRNSKNELNLLDLDDESMNAKPGNQSSTNGNGSLENDLLGLSMDDQPFGQGGGISLSAANPGFSTFTAPQTPMTPSMRPTPSTPAVQSTPQPLKPNYDAFAAFTKPATPEPPITGPSLNSLSPQFATKSFAAQQASQTRAAADPFQILNNKPATSSKPLASSTGSLLDIDNSSSAPSAPADDDWDFASAVAEEQPSKTTLTVSQKETGIVFDVLRKKPDDTTIHVLAKFSNNSASPISEYTFQIAVPKAYTLNLTTQSGRRLSPNQKNGITQQIEVHNVPSGKAGDVKVRWKSSYKSNGEARSENGEIAGLGIS